jgi:CBS domain-containing protein
MDVHSPVVSVDESIANARAVIKANGGSPVALVGPEGEFKGVLSSGALLVDGPNTAGQLGERARMTVAPHESAYSVVSRMLSRRIDWVPVLKQGKLVGTISRDCVMSAFGETVRA